MELKKYSEFEEFMEVVKENVEARLDKGYKVKYNQVIKNNGVELVGLVIYKRGISVAPNIYIDDLYKSYLIHNDMDRIIDKIIKTYNMAIKSEFVTTFNFDYDFEAIKENIYYRVVNYEKNKKLLKSIPHKRFLDLAIIFYCLVNNSKDEVASIRITNDHLKMWEKEGQEILELASKNTPILFPGIIRSMRDVIKDLIIKNSAEDIFGIENELCRDTNAYYFTGKKLDEDTVDEMLKQITSNKNCDMYVLSNVNAINGATAMLYNGLIEEFSNRIKSNVYILPSSVHEVILIPFNEDFNIDELKEMVKEINNTKVPDNEVLSDSVYVYQHKESAIFM